ncbi:hypothetical protein MHU86_5007 [Fragilaria crotonensis]|nr:hypothetical protein MHU86_5007 [Fragilaria crotonensis]
MGIPVNKTLLMIAFIIAAAALSIQRLDVDIKYIMATRWSIPASSNIETSAYASRTIATPSFQQPKDTSLWIYVEEYSEGMATWRKSLAEILMVAKKLNATVVEPCIRRILACV